MSYLDESLGPGEMLLARFELHWVAKWRLAVYVLLIIPTFGIALFAAIYELLRLRAIELGVTNRRVVRKIGIVSRSTDELRLASIETVDLHQTVMGRVLGYAEIRLTGRGESSMELVHLAEPLKAKAAIENAYAKHVEDRRSA